MQSKKKKEEGRRHLKMPSELSLEIGTVVFMMNKELSAEFFLFISTTIV